MVLAGNENFTILHLLHGVENPLSNSRYWWASIIRRHFWKRYISKIAKADYIAAAADFSNISRFKTLNNLTNEVNRFPTRFDDKVFRPLRSKIVDIPTFVFTGRLSKVKDIPFLLLSFKHYLEKFGEAQLYIIGDGELRDELTLYARELGIFPHVKFTGFLEKQDIAEVLNSAHVFLLTSKIEGWPTAMVEALACGLPSVSTLVSGASDMIKNGINGYVVPQRDPEVYAQQMKNALSLAPINTESIEAVENYKLSQMANSMKELFPNFFTMKLQ